MVFSSFLTSFLKKSQLSFSKERNQRITSHFYLIPSFCQHGLLLRSRFKKREKKGIESFLTLFPFGSPNWTRTSDTLINSQVLYRLSYGGKFDKVSEFTNLVCWRIPIVPERRHSSIVGTTELNFCVRNGNRWTLCVNLTNYSLQLCFAEPQSLHPSETFPSSAGIMHLQGFEPGTH